MQICTLFNKLKHNNLNSMFAVFNFHYLTIVMYAKIFLDKNKSNNETTFYYSDIFNHFICHCGCHSIIELQKSSKGKWRNKLIFEASDPVSVNVGGSKFSRISPLPKCANFVEIRCSKLENSNDGKIGPFGRTIEKGEWKAKNNKLIINTIIHLLEFWTWALSVFWCTTECQSAQSTIWRIYERIWRRWITICQICRRGNALIVGEHVQEIVRNITETKKINKINFSYRCFLSISDYDICFSQFSFSIGDR